MGPAPNAGIRRITQKKAIVPFGRPRPPEQPSAQNANDLQASDEDVDTDSEQSEVQKEGKLKLLNQKLQAVSPIEREEILEFLQDKVARDCGKAVQKAQSRIRSFQGGNSVYIDMHNTSQIFAEISQEIADEMALEQQFSIGTSLYDSTCEKH